MFKNIHIYIVWMIGLNDSSYSVFLALLFFSGSCHYGNLSDIGLFFHSSNIILVAVRNASSNMTSALTSLSLTDKSGILNIQFMMTLSEVISISLAYCRLHYWRLPPVWPLYSDLIFWIILLFILHSLQYTQLLYLLISLFTPLLNLYLISECCMFFCFS